MKENAPELLRKALHRLPVDVIATGDYQPAEKKFEVAQAGILTGISMMPILPGICDTDENLEATIRATAEHGGTFVVAGGLTLADQQRDCFFGVLWERFPDLLPLYQRMYPHETTSYGGIRAGDPHAIGRRIRDLCQQYGISDRMPRPIIRGDKRALNKRVVEALANECYWMEMNNAPKQRVWAYRKAAWAIEDTEQDVGLVYRQMGRKGLEGIENVGPRLAVVVEGLLAELSVSPQGCGRPGYSG